MSEFSVRTGGQMNVYTKSVVADVEQFEAFFWLKRKAWVFVASSIMLRTGCSSACEHLWVFALFFSVNLRNGGQHLLAYMVDNHRFVDLCFSVSLQRFRGTHLVDLM